MSYLPPKNNILIFNNIIHIVSIYFRLFRKRIQNSKIIHISKINQYNQNQKEINMYKTKRQKKQPQKKATIKTNHKFQSPNQSI